MAGQGCPFGCGYPVRRHGRAAGSAWLRTGKTGGSTPSRAGRRGLFRRSQGRRRGPGQTEDQFRATEHGSRARGIGSRRIRDIITCIIDAETPPLDQPIPNDFNHLHFGAARPRPEITLKPGDHTLQVYHRRQESHPALAAGHVTTHWRARGRNGLSKASPKDAARLFRRAAERAPHPPGSDDSLRPRQDGRRARRRGQCQYRASPPPRRRQDAAVEPADPERLQSSAFRSRTDGGDDDAAAWEAPAATSVRRRNHVPHDPPLMSAPNDVTVTETDPNTGAGCSAAGTVSLIRFAEKNSD